MEPANMRDGRLDAAGSRAFVAALQVDCLWLADPARAAEAKARFAASRVADCPLPPFRLTR